MVVLCLVQGKMLNSLIKDKDVRLGEYREAALAKNKKACYRLGEIYESGLNVPQDLVAAAEWYSAALATEKLTALAERNPRNAVIRDVLADYYQAEDLERSIKLYKRSARLGNDVAMQKCTLAFQQVSHCAEYAAKHSLRINTNRG